MIVFLSTGFEEVAWMHKGCKQATPAARRKRETLHVLLLCFQTSIISRVYVLVQNALLPHTLNKSKQYVTSNLKRKSCSAVIHPQNGQHKEKQEAHYTQECFQYGIFPGKLYHSQVNLIRCHARFLLLLFVVVSAFVWVVMVLFTFVH